MRAAVAISCLTLAVAFATAAPGHAQTIKITTSPNNIFYAECKADEVVSRCNIDSGDEDLLTLRPDPLFEPYPAVGRRRRMGITGRVSSYKVVQVGTFKIGDVALHQIKAHIHGRPDSYSRVGLKLFRQWGRATFDFSDGEIRADGPNAASRCATPFDPGSGIRIPVSVSGDALDATWDTGTNYTVVSDRYIASHPDAFELVRDGLSGSDAGSAKFASRLFRMKKITFCGRDFTNLEVIALDMTGPTRLDPKFPQILVGANLMAGHRWAFDFIDRSWSFD